MIAGGRGWLTVVLAVMLGSMTGVMLGAGAGFWLCRTVLNAYYLAIP
jgi:hypothetical protein